MAALTPEVRAEIGAFLQKAKEGTLVQSENGLHELLLQKKLAWRLKLTCDFIGVHPQNRISASHVQDLITNIAGIGFSRAESRCICIEVPEDARGDGCRDFNVRLASEAHGKLAPVNPAILKFASIVGSHANQAGRCFWYGMPHPDEKVTGKLAPVNPAILKFASIVGSHANQAGRCFWYGMPHPDEKVTINGALSLEKLAKIDPAWTSSIREGLDWMVVSAQIVDAFPEYVGLAQSAGNAAGQIASAEGELQLARKVNQAIADFLARGGKDTVSYTDVSGAILRSKPPSASALPGIFTFVLRYGGGAGPDSFLSRSETFIRAHGYAARSLGSDFWQAMGAEIKGSADQKVIWRHMILKLAFCGPEKILQLGDIRRAMSAKDILNKASEAEKLAIRMTGLLSAEPKLTLQLGDIRRAMSAKDILNKASEAEKLAIRMTGLLSAEPKLTAQVVAATMAEVEMEFVAVIFQKKKFTNRTSLEQASSEKTECNVELVGPSKTWANQRLDKLTSAVQLPCIKNFRKIDIEDSLVFYRPGLARTEAVEQLVPVNPVAKKKAKTS
eukprot:s1148_g20.t2